MTYEPMADTYAADLHRLLDDPANRRALHLPPTTPENWRQAIGDWAEDEDQADFILLEAGEVVGWISYNGLDSLGSADPRLWVRMLVIAPEHQGRGLGGEAMHWAIRRAVEMGFSAMGIQTTVDNERALALYQRLGFQIINEREAYGEVARVVLHLPITGEPGKWDG